MCKLEAILVHDSLPRETESLIADCLREAGWERLRILSRLPEVVAPGQFLVVDELVAGSSAESLLAGMAGSEVGTCVLVSWPYLEKLERLKFGAVQLSDMFIIKGPPKRPNHLDLFITSTIEPGAITALFKRIRKSLAGKE